MCLTNKVSRIAVRSLRSLTKFHYPLSFSSAVSFNGDWNTAIDKSQKWGVVLYLQVMIALRTHKQIANCPVRMQRLIARYGVLESFNEKRCIVKQGHPAQAFYYIFYGTGNCLPIALLVDIQQLRLSKQSITSQVQLCTNMPFWKVFWLFDKKMCFGCRHH